MEEKNYRKVLSGNYMAQNIAKMSLYDMYELMEDKISILKMTEPKEVDESHQKAKKKDKNREAR